VLHPDDRHALRACALDCPGDIADDACAVPRGLHHADLHVDDEENDLVALPNNGHASAALFAYQLNATPIIGPLNVRLSMLEPDLNS